MGTHLCSRFSSCLTHLASHRWRGGVGVVGRDRRGFLFRFQFPSLRKNHSLSWNHPSRNIILFLVLFADNQLSLNCLLKNPTFFFVFILPFFCIRSQILVLVSIQLSALETQGSSLTVFLLVLHCAILSKPDDFPTILLSWLPFWNTNLFMSVLSWNFFNNLTADRIKYYLLSVSHRAFYCLSQSIFTFSVLYCQYLNIRSRQTAVCPNTPSTFTVPLYVLYHLSWVLPLPFYKTTSQNLIHRPLSSQAPPDDTDSTTVLAKHLKRYFYRTF